MYIAVPHVSFDRSRFLQRSPRSLRVMGSSGSCSRISNAKAASRKQLLMQFVTAERAPMRETEEGFADFYDPRVHEATSRSRWEITKRIACISRSREASSSTSTSKMRPRSHGKCAEKETRLRTRWPVMDEGGQASGSNRNFCTRRDRGHRI